MRHIDHQLIAILERQSLERERIAAERRFRRPGRPIRHRIGASLIRIGERLADDRRTSPVPTG